MLNEQLLTLHLCPALGVNSSLRGFCCHQHIIRILKCVVLGKRSYWHSFVIITGRWDVTDNTYLCLADIYSIHVRHNSVSSNVTCIFSWASRHLKCRDEFWSESNRVLRESDQTRAFPYSDLRSMVWLISRPQNPFSQIERLENEEEKKNPKVISSR